MQSKICAWAKEKKEKGRKAKIGYARIEIERKWVESGKK